MMHDIYTEDYFQRGVELGISCYSNFTWLPEKTIPAAFRFIEYLGLTEQHTVLDFGCSYGYLVKALRLLRRQAWGCDISVHAIEQAPADVRPYLVLLFQTGDIPYCHGKAFDVILARDVLEHLDYDDLDPTLRVLRSRGRSLFAIIPLGDGSRYVIPAAERDVTHKIRQDLTWWCNRFSANGFSIAEATYNVPHLKDHWKTWLDKKGYGFFLCR